MLLSICISSYNHIDKLENTICSLLGFHYEDVEIVVTDDCSDTSIFDVLGKYTSPYLKIYRNEKNKGPIINWYNTLNNGSGEYLLHLLDRDIMNGSYIPILINFLRNNNADFGYIGSCLMSPDLRRYKKQDFVLIPQNDVVNVLGILPVHPSGFIVSKSAWNSISNKERYFDEKIYGIYPHQYIYSCLCDRYRGFISELSMFTIVDNTIDTMRKVTSSFYLKSKESFYWTPEAQLQEILKSAKFCMKETNWPWCEKRQVIIKRFGENLKRVVSYRMVMISSRTCMHYNVPQRYVSNKELKEIKKRFISQFLEAATTIFEKEQYEEIVQDVQGIIDGFKIDDVAFAKRICRNDLEKNIYQAWVENMLNGKDMLAYFRTNGIHSVAIYGCGEMGKLLDKAIQGTDICLKYYVDKSAYKYKYEKIEVKRIDQIDDSIDAIVISIPSEFVSISNELSSYTSVPIISITDLILF